MGSHDSLPSSVVVVSGKAVFPLTKLEVATTGRISHPGHLILTSAPAPQIEPHLSLGFLL